MKKLQKSDRKELSDVSENINSLKRLFPEAFTEDGLSLEILSKFLGEEVSNKEESFGLSWHGKNQALQNGLSEATGTLRPCPDESVNWDNTQNLFIEGDNLEVLKLLKLCYAGKIKMVYIDPPYNTEGDFIYSDSFQDSIHSYLKYTEQVDESGAKLSSNTETNGRKHTNWLNMMYPRLKLARSLLSENGVLICHIDEHEFINLCYLMDEIFGKENNLGPIIWDKKNPKGNATRIATQHEYIVMYAKNAEVLLESVELKRPKQNAEKLLNRATKIFAKKGKLFAPKDLREVAKKYKLPINIDDYRIEYNDEQINSEYNEWLSQQNISNGEKAYKFIDTDGNVYQSVHMGAPSSSKYRTPLKHPDTDKDCTVPDKGWRNPPAFMNELLEKGQIIFGENEKTQPRRKYILSENMEENIPSILPFGGSNESLLKKLGIPFDNPKPVEFSTDLLSFFLEDGDIVIDFFAGSATTAHASMKLCVENEINVRNILVQIPEKINSKKNKAAVEFCEVIGKPLNIAEISKERVRRTAKMIKDEFPGFEADLGFKVFKLDSSNIRVWNSDPNELEGTLLEHTEPIIEGRSEQDILYELLLIRGVDLAVPIEEKTIASKLVYSIGYGVSFVCLDESLDEKAIETLGLGIVEWRNNLNPISESKVFFRDSAFADDVAKSNMTAILEQNGISNVSSI